MVAYGTERWEDKVCHRTECEHLKLLCDCCRQSSVIVEGISCAMGWELRKALKARAYQPKVRELNSQRYQEAASPARREFPWG